MRQLEDKLFEREIEGSKCEKFRTFSRLKEAAKDWEFFKLGVSSMEICKPNWNRQNREKISKLLSTPGILN